MLERNALMPDTTQTPLMLLVVPVPEQRPGPTWAFDLYDLIFLIDSHDHSLNKGTPVTPAGFDVTSNFSMQGSDGVQYDLTDARTLRLFPNAAAPAGLSDLQILFSLEDGELYYRDGAGNEVQITLNGALDAASIGGISGLVAPAAAVYTPGTGTFSFVQDVGTSANMDHGPLLVREPVVGGKRVKASAPAALAADYDTTLPPALPTVTSHVKATTAGVLSFEQNDLLAVATLGGDAASLDSGVFEARDVLEILIFGPGLSAGEALSLQFNADNGNHYNGSTIGCSNMDGVGVAPTLVVNKYTNQASLNLDEFNHAADHSFVAKITVVNKATAKKAAMWKEGRICPTETSSTIEGQGFWDNTAAQITRVKLLTFSASANLRAGCGMIVRGWNMS
jgi:hypothetical protein